VTARKSFAKILKLMRLEHGYSQEELAHKASLSMRSISLFECDKQQPTISSIEAICKALQINMVDMIDAVEEDMSNSDL